MTPAKRKPTAHTTPADTKKAVDDFMLALEHPRKREIESLRRIVLGVDPKIAEGIKWNSPSFRTHEYFATMNLRAKDRLDVILHLGAKVKDNATSGIEIRDPKKLLKWLAKDRAMVSFADGADLAEKKAAFARVLEQWIANV